MEAGPCSGLDTVKKWVNSLTVLLKKSYLTGGKTRERACN